MEKIIYGIWALILAVFVVTVVVRLFKKSEFRSTNKDQRNTGNQPAWKHMMDPAPRKSHYRSPSPTPTPAPDPYFDSPILNPIHPLHSAFVPSDDTHHHSAPSPSYNCPSPSPSYDSGSSCDSPSPSPSSWD